MQQVNSLKNLPDTVRIYVKNGSSLYQVFSLYMLSDGSFKVDVPYCHFDKCAVLKIPISYSGVLAVSRDNFVQEFSLENRPQLSIHASGLVQFSGSGIVSGITNGRYKGVALQSAPLATPIETGPTCSVAIWGLDAGYKKVTSQKKDSIVFDVSACNRPEAFYNRHYKNDVGFNSYLFELWVFPMDDYYAKTIRVIDSIEWMVLSFPNYDPRPGAVFAMRVIRLQKINSFIALIPFKFFMGFAEKSAFGFVLNSPTEKSAEYPGKWNSLQAVFPDFFNTTKRGLDF